jgi:hypothetical protein
VGHDPDVPNAVQRHSGFSYCHVCSAFSWAYQR